MIIIGNLLSLDVKISVLNHSYIVIYCLQCVPFGLNSMWVWQSFFSFPFKYEFQASFLEIYNETIRDLLGNGKDDVKHEIKMVAAHSNQIQVTNLTAQAVTQQEQVRMIANIYTGVLISVIWILNPMFIFCEKEHLDFSRRQVPKLVHLKVSTRTH